MSARHLGLLWVAALGLLHSGCGGPGFGGPEITTGMIAAGALLGLLRYRWTSSHKAEPPIELGTPGKGVKVTRGGAVRKPQAEIGTEASGPDQDAAVSSDEVQCSVFSPQTSSRGGSFLVQVFAHLREDAEAVRALSREADAEAARRGIKTLAEPVERGSPLTFVLSAPGADIDEPTQTLTWRGSPESVQFGVTIPQDSDATEVIATVYVTQHSVPFGHVKFVVRFAGAAEPTAPAHETVVSQDFTRYKHAFVSYATADRVEVLKRVQMLARVRIDFFQDLLSLEPGERWERSLYKHIDKSDVFFLFWSTHARDSEWVIKEATYALERKHGVEQAPPEIVPVIIEGPPLVPPPPALKDLHFNDTFAYFIRASS